ncbi:hypothetical protein [Actinophytocola algeriensis]|uniref:DUF4386 family protein n=1 Tax=Actinophytocola algeriensis TaxID=1768010 RepID=A0A7W7Q5V9_9PSEU|nr:hypothetical protein [Actinophytocola algeriensis]MBB4907615.1 hypothetical protein [Actinophytocola algeriensis]MBE1479645.1 hypothetical protein [Actinophytocola algeriensis]
MIRTAFFAAPFFLLLGVLGMKLGWKPNPDLDWTVALPLWTAAHLAYIIGNLAMLAVLATLWTWTRDAARHRAERIAVGVIAFAGLVGTVAMTGQMVIDLIVGFRAGARSEMSAISRSIHELPGFETFFYGAVPALGLAGVALLALIAAARRQMPVWPAVVFLPASVSIGTGITALMIIGGLTSCFALPAMVRPVPLTAPADAGGVAVAP